MKKKKLFGLKKQVFRSLGLMDKKIWIYSISIIVMAALFGLVMEVYISYKLKFLLDASIEGNFSLIKVYSIQMALAIIIPGIVCPLLSYVIFYCIKNTMTQVKIGLYKKTIKLPMSYYEKNHSQEIISCLNNDLNLLEQLYFWPIFNLLCSTMIGIGSISILIYFSPIFAVFSISLGIITVIVNAKYAKVLRKQSNLIQQKIANITGILSDYLKSFMISKIYFIGNMLAGKFNETNDLHFEFKMNYIKKGAKLDSINTILYYLGYLFVIVVGTIFVSKHILTVGTAIACIQLHQKVGYMFDNFGTFIAQTQYCLSGAERVFKIFDEKEEEDFNKEENQLITNVEDEIDAKDIIAIKELEFSYDGIKTILEDIDMSIEMGKITAVVGKSGSGKSSIIKSLLGFYPIKSGNIYFNGKSISKYSLKDIRNMISYVPQEAMLFYGTIKENIGLGIDDEEAIVEAAKSACIHDFIMELPDKYNTLVGENGVKLSGGQKQRIAIARAMLKEAQIIIFDEATSALEHELEIDIFNSIKRISPNRAVIIISHRLFSIEMADKIYMIKDGHICESGNHSELMDEKGMYYELVNLQTASIV